jgi:hypothetical protein
VKEGKHNKKREVTGGQSKMGDAVADIEEGGLTRTLKDLFAGAAGGIAQVLLGKPLCFLEIFLGFYCFTFLALLQPFWFLLSRASI